MEDQIIYFNTKEFEEFEKISKIKKEDAFALCSEYCFQKKKTFGRLFAIVDSQYVFSDFFNAKIPTFTLSGFYIHSRTGDVTYQKGENIPSPCSQFGWFPKQ